MAFKKQTFFKGVAIIMVAQVIIKFFGFLYRVILTNIEGFQDVGNSYYSSGYKVYIFILAIATTGIPSAISKLVSEKIALGDKRGAHRVFKISMQIFTIVGIIFSLVLFLGAEFIANNFLSNPGVYYTIASLAPAVFFVSLAAVFRGYFVGLGNVVAHSVAQIVEQIINSILSVVFVLMLVGNSPEIMAMGSTLATAASTFVALLYLWFYYIKNKKHIYSEIKNSAVFDTEKRRSIVKKIFKYVIPISLASVVSSIVGIVDLITVVNGLVEYYTNLGVADALTVANEKFGIILGKVDILTSIPYNFNVAIVVPLIPAISAHFIKGEKEEAKKKINVSMKLSTLIAFPCAAGLTLLAYPIFNTIYPNANEGALLLQIEVWSVIFALMSNTAQSALTGIGKLYVPAIAIGAGAITKYLLNIWLVPIYGEIVVPITTTMYHIAGGGIAIFVLYRAMKTKPDIKNIIFKPALATVMMSIVVFLTQNVLVNINISETVALCISVILGVLTYFWCVLKVGAIAEEELSQIPYGNKLCHLLRKSKKVEKKC